MDTRTDGTVPITVSKITIHINNKGLKKLFPGTVITKKKLAIGEIDIPFLIQAIKSQKQTDYTNFQLMLDKEGRAIFELEGEFNSWDLEIKLIVF
jgi:hypothetical protein